MKVCFCCRMESADGLGPGERCQLCREARCGKRGRCKYRRRIAKEVRRARRFRKHYLSAGYVLAVKAEPCAVPGCRTRPSDAAHARTKGAGATWADLVPLCHEHHMEQHTRGIRTFEDRYGVNLQESAVELERRLGPVRQRLEREQAERLKKAHG